MIMRYIFILFILSAFSYNHASSLEETTITIKSDRASCSQGALDKKLFTLSYFDNVSVNFSDGIQAKANKLIIFLNTEKPTEQPKAAKKNLDQIQKIILTKDVAFFHEGRSAYADKAIIIPTTQECELSGNVRIIQKKITDKDFPVEINCSNAAMNLISGKIDLNGTSEEPVSTTLVINKTAKPLQKKHKSHHGKHQATIPK